MKWPIKSTNKNCQLLATNITVMFCIVIKYHLSLWTHIVWEKFVCSFKQWVPKRPITHRKGSFTHHHYRSQDPRCLGMLHSFLKSTGPQTHTKAQRMVHKAFGNVWQRLNRGHTYVHGNKTHTHTHTHTNTHTHTRKTTTYTCNIHINGLF